jgi:hypothetical protein
MEGGRIQNNRRNQGSEGHSHAARCRKRDNQNTKRNKVRDRERDTHILLDIEE